MASDQTKFALGENRFARTEGIVPAPELNHASRAAVDEALAAREQGAPRVILFNLSGHGHFGHAAYGRCLGGQPEDYEYASEEVAPALESVPVVSGH